VRVRGLHRAERRQRPGPPDQVHVIVGGVEQEGVAVPLGVVDEHVEAIEVFDGCRDVALYVVSDPDVGG